MTKSPDIALIDLLTAYAPVEKWFSNSQLNSVVVDIYRVYKQPFVNAVVFPSAIQVIDFDSLRARAVFVRTQFQIPDYESGAAMFPTPEGGMQVRPQKSWVVLEQEDLMRSTQREIWHDTEEGIFLLIITPSLTGTGLEDTATPIPYAVEMTLDMVRGAVILHMGRNAAFERVFRAEIVLDLDRDQSRLNLLTTGRGHPDGYDEPALNGFTAEEAQQFVQNIREADEDIKSRVSLALRWYLKALIHPTPTGELKIDHFIYYWIAFEALTMPNGDYRDALQQLAEIHNLPLDQVRAVFPIGRLLGLRARILHRGEVYPLDNGLIAFMDALCVDATMHLLGISKEPRTRTYLDGSANNLLPRITKAYRLPQEEEN